MRRDRRAEQGRSIPVKTQPSFSLSLHLVFSTSCVEPHAARLSCFLSPLHSHTQAFENIGALPPSHSLTPLSREPSRSARSACLSLPLLNHPVPTCDVMKGCNICFLMSIINVSPSPQGYFKDLFFFPSFPCFAVQKGRAKNTQLSFTNPLVMSWRSSIPETKSAGVF